LLQKGFEVTFADISDIALGFTKWRVKKRKLKARFIDLKKEKLPKNSFDFVVSIDVLEHIVDYKKTLKEIFESLEKEGLFLAHVGPKKRKWPMHLNSPEQVFKAAKKIGFIELEKPEKLRTLFLKPENKPVINIHAHQKSQ